MVRVVVVGGGLTGLVTAWFLRETAPPDFRLDVRVLERQAELGGSVRTQVTPYGPLEDGPIAFDAGTPDASRLVHSLGLESKLVPSAAADVLGLFRAGRFQRWPRSAIELLTRTTLSWRARLRLLHEPFVKTSKAIDESAADFAARRLGPEVAERVLSPLVAATWGGDPKRLSARDTLSGLFAMERRHDRLAIAWLAKRWRRAAVARERKVSTLRGGLETLVRALADKLGDRVQCSARVRGVWNDGDGYGLDLDGASVPVMRADVLVLAIASKEAAATLERGSPDLAAMLSTIPFARVAHVWLVWKRADLARPPGASAALTTLLRGDLARKAFAVDAPSAAFPSEFPDEFVALRFFFGTQPTLDPGVASDEMLIASARAEAEAVYGARGDPAFTRVVRSPDRAQATLGHHGRLLAIDSMLRREPNLFVAGSSYRGIGIDDAIRNGRKTAEHIVHQLLLGNDGRPVRM